MVMTSPSVLALVTQLVTQYIKKAVASVSSEVTASRFLLVVQIFSSCYVLHATCYETNVPPAECLAAVSVSLLMTPARPSRIQVLKSVLNLSENRN